MMSIFRVNFFKLKGEVQIKQKKIPTKPDPDSKSGKKRVIKKVKNKERRLKRKQIKHKAKRERQKAQHTTKPV